MKESGADNFLCSPCRLSCNKAHHWLFLSRVVEVVSHTLSKHVLLVKNKGLNIAGTLTSLTELFRLLKMG